MSLKNKILLAFIYCVFSFGCREKVTPDMPPFDLLLPDSTTILNSNQIPIGKPIMLFYFSPDCEHCQQETEILLKNISSLKDVRMYFITDDPFDRMKVFNEYYRLVNYSNIIIGRDYNFGIYRYFKMPITPFIVLYNTNKESRVLLKGPFPASRIIEEVHKL